MSLFQYPNARYTSNIGFALFGQDEVLAENWLLADQAYASGSSINVNGTLVPSPNLSSTLPVAPPGEQLATFQFDANGNISAYVPIPAAGGVTSFSGDSVVYNNALSAGAVTLSLIAQTANTVFAGPTLGGVATPTFRALVAADLPAGTGTVTSFSAGSLSPLFTTSVATATTTPALTFALTNAAGGTVFGNATTGAAAPGYTIAPVLGIPGTSTGSIAIASSTASGKYTITAPANAATPTLTLPTTSNVLAGQFAGDNVLYSGTPVGATAAGTLALPTLSTQTANFVFAGPTSGAAAAPTFRALVAADIPTAANLPLWSNLQNAAAALSLSNANYATTFNQTSAVAWLWANTTVATIATTNASPLLELAAQYWATGAATGTDLWTVGIAALTAGLNSPSTLTFTHTGSTGSAAVRVPLLDIGGTDVGISRLAAGSLAIGNGTASDQTGTLNVAKITSNSTQLLLEQTGETFGTTQLALRNRVGSAGAIFINSGLDLVDLGFLTSTSVQFNLRYEHRVGQIQSANTSGEMQVLNVTSGVTAVNTMQMEVGLATFAVRAPLFVLGATSTVPALGVLIPDVGISRLGAGSLAIGNGTAGNTTGNLSFNRVNLAGADYAGQATITAAATTKAVTFAANYVGTAQPVIVLTPTTDPLALGVPVGYWVTYSGGAGAWTGFTVNIQTALAGDVTFNYLVVGKA